jgi:hypothetical protein
MEECGRYVTLASQTAKRNQVPDGQTANKVETMYM